MDNVAILVDGEFFIKQFRKHHPGGEEASPGDIAKELHRLCVYHLKTRNGKHQDRLYRIIVYDCPPMLKRVHHPLTNRAINLAKSKTAVARLEFHQELRKLRKVALRLGKIDEENAAWAINPAVLRDLLYKKRAFESLEEHEVNFIGRQKAVDMKIGLDISSLAIKRMVNKIVLIAGDSDFVPAAKLARREGIDFVLDPMWKTVKPDLQEHIDGIRTTIRKKISTPKVSYEHPSG
jgi:uncharacterized LabA/DUF88 family protein